MDTDLRTALTDKLALVGLIPGENCAVFVKELADIGCWVVDIEVDGDNLVYELAQTEEGALLSAIMEVEPMAELLGIGSNSA
jgi:hypothetical protein